MRSWNPRPPSAKLKQRLFGPAAGESRARHARNWLIPAMAWLRVSNWLAPAMVVFVLAAVVANQGAPGLGNLMLRPSTGLVASDAVRYPQLAAFYESRRHSGHNAWREATFEWTNGSQSISTADSIWDVWATNQLIR